MCRENNSFNCFFVGLYVGKYRLWFKDDLISLRRTNLTALSDSNNRFCWWWPLRFPCPNGPSWKVWMAAMPIYRWLAVVESMDKNVNILFRQCIIYFSVKKIIAPRKCLYVFGRKRFLERLFWLYIYRFFRVLLPQSSKCKFQPSRSWAT